jgi:hypothetical protein
MAQQDIDVGSFAGDGTGDPLRDAFTKINENFTELYSGNVQVTAANVLVYSVAGRTGNIVLTVNDVSQAASKGYVDNSIAANLANVTTTITNSLNANITAANAVISNHTSRIGTLESNSAAQATQINNLVSVKANVSYVDTSIGLALSSNAILANVASVNANVAAANAAILLRANLTGAAFSGNISANSISALNLIRTDTYFVGGTEINQGLGQTFANPAALFFGNSSISTEKFFQVNLQNLDPGGSGDFVVTADDGNDADYFVAFGIAGSLSNEPEYPSQKPHDGYVFVRGGDLDIQSETGNVELIAGNLAVGQVILTSGNIVKFGPGVQLQFADGTLQSTAFGGNASVASIKANITAANAAITALQANAAVQALDLDSLLSNSAAQGSTLNSLTTNAASQAVAIDSVNANIGAYQTFANANISGLATSISTINANVVAANIRINTLLSNAAVQALDIDNLYSNSSLQQSDIVSLQANATTQSVQITLLNANLSAANTDISSLTSNSATQGTQINLLNANVVAANINITNLQTNAATQALQLDNLQTNVNSWYSSIAATNANVSAANARIVVLDANLGSTSTNVTSLRSDITNLIANKANVAGSTVFSGNLQASYLLANNSAKIGSLIEVGQPSPVAYPDLAAVFIGNVDGYYQLVLQNTNSGPNASGDIVITADDGDDTNYYLNIGVNSSNWSGNFVVPAGDTGVPEFAHDAYFTAIGGNLALRTDSNVYFVANTVFAGLEKDGNFTIFNTNLEFSDGSVQSTAVTDVAGLLANVDTFYNDFITIDANIGSLYNTVDSVDANIGAFQTYANVTFGPDSYADANVQAYLAAFDGNIIPSANITYSLGSSAYQWKDLWVSNNTIYIGNVPITVSNGNLLVNGNLVTGSGGSGTDDVLRANVGAYQTFANANAATQATSINTFNANMGAYQTYGNLTFSTVANATSQATDITTLYANAATQATGINTFNANLGAYQTFANANAATQATAINTINANVGAYQTWANTVGFIGNINGNNGVTYFGSNIILLSTTGAVTQDQLLNIFTGNTGAQVSFAGNGNVIVNEDSWIELRQTSPTPNPLKFNIETWDANIGTQANAINTINANIGAYQVYANATFTTSSYGNSNVKSYLGAFDGNILPSANITYDLGSANYRWRDLWLSGNTINLGSALLSAVGNTIQLPAGSTVGGASVDVVSINANITAANLEIAAIQSNLAIQANVLDVLSGNAVTQQSELANLVANAATQASELNTLVSNAATQASELNTLISNAATQSGAINSINANIGAYQAYANSTFSTSSYGNANVAAYLPTYTGNISAGNLTVSGNITQQSAYYEKFANVSNTGGNLTLNLVDGSTFYANLSSNVTANFTNVAGTLGTAVGITVIVDQGNVAYGISNIQVNGGSVQTIKWAGGTTNVGTASNTDIISFSLLNLDGTNYRILGQINNYG